MLKDLLKLKKAREYLESIKIGGSTFLSVLFSGDESNSKNTIAGMLKAYKDSAKVNASPDEFNRSIAQQVKARKTSFLRTAKNVMLAVRQDASNRFVRDAEYFYSYVVYDGKSSRVCPAYISTVWEMPWSKIPQVERPPRTSGAYHKGVHHHVHACRSRIIAKRKGQPKPDSRDAITQFNDLSKNEKRELLGRKSVWKAYESGELDINTSRQLENSRLLSIKQILK